MKNKVLFVLAMLLIALTVVGCATDADVASENLKKGAEMFEIRRRVVFYNSITDTYILEIDGFCSIEDRGNKLDLTCKVSQDEFYIHYLGLSDNVTYVVEQMDAANVSEYHYRTVFKPEAILPDIDLRIESKSN